MLFVKEDLIIPHHFSFYELIETRAMGKTGPLFVWEAQNEVPNSNVSKESRESHCVKIVERRWYDSNKHIYPMNRWEAFDPLKASEGQ